MVHRLFFNVWIIVSNVLILLDVKYAQTILNIIFKLDYAKLVVQMDKKKLGVGIILLANPVKSMDVNPVNQVYINVIFVMKDYIIKEMNVHHISVGQVIKP